mgnify:CR=1 FL=1
MNDLIRRKEAIGVLETMTEVDEGIEMMYSLPAIEKKPVIHERWKNEDLTIDKAIQYLESIIYEDFAPYTQKCLLKVIEAARNEESMTANWEKRMERIIEKLEQQKQQYKRRSEKAEHVLQRDHFFGKMCSYDHAIEIVKAGGEDDAN